MNIKATVFMLTMATLVFSQEKNYAFDVSAGLAYDTDMYIPIPSLSFYWLKNKGFHELSGEMYQKETTDNFSSRLMETQSVWGYGFSYSFLFKTPLRYIFLGPTLGLIGYEKHITIGTHNPEILGSGAYFCGAKLAFIYGESTIRFKIQERVLFGITEKEFSDESGYGVLNTVNAGVIFAF